MDCEKQCLLRPLGDKKQADMLPITNPTTSSGFSSSACCCQHPATGRCQYKQLKHKVLVYTGQVTLLLLGALLLLAAASGAVGLLCGIAPTLAASTCAARNQAMGQTYPLLPQQLPPWYVSGSQGDLPVELLLLEDEAAYSSAGAGRKLQQATDDFLVDDFQYPDAGPRIEGTGSYGSVADSLLTRLNALARDVDRIGSAADSASIASGDDTAQRRFFGSAIQSLPLRTAGLGIAGTAATGLGTTTALDAGSASVAKDIFDDIDSNPVDLGAAANAQGFTITDDAGRGAPTSGSQTQGAAITGAGEQSISISPVLDLILGTGTNLRDGAAGLGRMRTAGIGDRSSTRTQVSALAAVDKNAPEDGPDGSIGGDADGGMDANFGGAVLRAYADTVDRPDFLATSVPSVDFNTFANTAALGRANRYKYTRGLITGEAAARSTDAARSRLAGGSFGTGFGNTLRASTSSATFLDPCDDPERRDKLPRCVEAAADGGDGTEGEEGSGAADLGAGGGVTNPAALGPTTDATIGGGATVGTGGVGSTVSTTDTDDATGPAGSADGSTAGATDGIATGGSEGFAPGSTSAGDLEAPAASGA